MVEQGRFTGAGTTRDKNMFLSRFDRGKHRRLFGGELPRMKLSKVFDESNLPVSSVAGASLRTDCGVSPHDARGKGFDASTVLAGKTTAVID